MWLKNRNYFFLLCALLCCTTAYSLGLPTTSDNASNVKDQIAGNDTTLSADSKTIVGGEQKPEEKILTTPSTTSTSTSSTTESTTTSTTPPPPPKTTTTTTTTTSTTTTSTTTSSTTTTTSTVPPPTTTTKKPQPTPFPKPAIGKWSTDCILLQMATQFNISYNTTDNTTMYGLYNLPVNQTDASQASCQPTLNSVAIEWGSKENINALTVVFRKDGSDFILYQFILKLHLDNSSFPKSKDNYTELIHMRNDFITPLKMSYHCTKPQTLNLTDKVENKTTLGTIKVMNLQFEAFRTSSTAGFSTAKDCDSADTSDIVPIAVGITLVALILITVIAYLVARRRSTARGYMSF